MSQPAPMLENTLEQKPTPELSGFVEVAAMAAVSVLLIIPCLWQARLIAGNLSSHAYNAWLATEIRAGRVTGLSLVTTWTNVLTDWLLERLTPITGNDLAMQLVAAVSVLIFFWGAFFLITTTSGRRPWILAPLLGMLSYGLVFHLGLLNFYLSVGLSLWILGLMWKPSIPKMWCALPLILLATLAHPLPLIWMAAVAGYWFLFQKAPPIGRMLLPILGVAGLFGLQKVILTRLPVRWSLTDLATMEGFAGIIGAGQVWLYDQKYLVIATGVALSLAILLLERVDKIDFLGDPAVQIWILHLAAFVLIPSNAGLMAHSEALTYIPEKISLLVALSFCIMVSKAAYGRGVTRLSGIVALAYFTLLFMDAAAFNRAEEQITRVVREAPAGSRVIAAVSDEGSRINALAHVADQACIGHCFSYANYEPATGQFRIRLTGEGGHAPPTMETVKEIESGQHIVTAAEDPLYAVCPSVAGDGTLSLRRLRGGERTCASSRVFSVRLSLPSLPDLPK